MISSKSAYLVVLALFVIPLFLNGQNVFLLENNGPSTTRLIKISLNTCDTTHLFNGTNNYADIAITSDSTCWVVGNASKLYRLNLNTGEEQLIVNLPQISGHTINGLTADDQYIYASGQDLILYDYKNDLVIHKGLLPEHMAANGDLTFYNGKLYQTGGLGYLIEVNINKPENSVIIDTLPGDNGFYSGIVSYSYSCDSAFLFLSGNTEGINSYNLKTKEINNICDIDLWIHGAATYNEHLSASCNLSVDLDFDNSSRTGLDFAKSVFCDFRDIPVSDTDIIINSTKQIDSLQIILHHPRPLPDAPFEFLNSEPLPGITVSGNNTEFLTLTNNGSATSKDFQQSLLNTFYNNTRDIPTDDVREIWGIPFHEGESGDTATAYLSVKPPRHVAGRDTTVEVCSSAPVFDMEELLDDIASANGYWTHFPLSGSTEFNPALDTSDTFAYVAQDPFCPDTALISIVVSDQLSLDLGNDTSICSDANLLLTPDLPLSGEFLWQDNSQTPTYNVQNEGLFWLEYTSENGCMASDSIYVSFSEIIQGDTLNKFICNGESFQFNDNIVQEPGIYADTIRSPGGCDSIASLKLNIFPPPDFGIQGDSVLCNNEQGILKVADDFDSYTWNTGHITPSIIIDSAGWYIIKVTDESGCMAVDSIFVKNSSAMNFSYTASDPICARQASGSLHIDSISGGVPPYSAFVNDIPLPAGDQLDRLSADTYILRIEDSQGCIARDTFELKDPDDWQIDINGPRDPLTPNETLYLTVESTLDSIASFNWFANDPFINTSSSDASLIPTSNQLITLQQTDKRGCTKADSIYIQIDNSQLLYLPNTFTPNRDGLNETWHPVMPPGSISDLQLKIFDRWGELLYECKGLQCEWDGKFRSQDCASGTYMFQIRYKLLFDTNWHTKYGTVTLLR